MPAAPETNDPRHGEPLLAAGVMALYFPAAAPSAGVAGPLENRSDGVLRRTAGVGPPVFGPMSTHEKEVINCLVQVPCSAWHGQAIAVSRVIVSVPASGHRAGLSRKRWEKAPPDRFRWAPSSWPLGAAAPCRCGYPS